MSDEELIFSDKHDVLEVFGSLAVLLLLSVTIAGWSIYEIWRFGGLFVRWILT
jgi:hypothetical protein